MKNCLYSAFPKREIAAAETYDALIAHFDPVDKAPKYAGVIDLYSGNVHAVAVRTIGLLWYQRWLKRLATKGHPQAIRALVVHACETVELIEDIARTKPEFFQELASRRADWPVMLCRHESSNKNVSSYLDRIGLGLNCVINADGRRVAKYSLRTPINSFVWRTLKGLRFWIGLSCDRPEIAKIKLNALPVLTKTTAKLWVDKALMPFVCASYEDFHQVSEFALILRRPGVKTRGQQRREIRKDIIRAFQSLAPTA